MNAPVLKLCGYFHSDLSFGGQPKTPVRAVKEYEIEYIQQDGGISVINDLKYQMHKGDIIIAKPGDKRFSILTGPLVSIYIRINADGYVAEKLNALPRSFPLFKSDQVQTIMSEIISKTASDQTDKLYIVGNLLLLISLLIADSKFENKELVSLYPRMHKAKKFIETHYFEQIKTDDIAQSIFMSESHFRFSFRKLYGITPHDYLIQTRIEIAKELLSSTTHSIAEIAAMCQLGSSKNFSTLFHKKTGLTPTSYRRETIHKYIK